MTTLPSEKKGKNILGTAGKINHRVGSLPQACCSGYPARCSLDINNEGSQAPEEPAYSGLKSSLQPLMDSKLPLASLDPRRLTVKWAARISWHPGHGK